MVTHVTAEAAFMVQTRAELRERHVADDTRELLSVLKSELAFLENGGYWSAHSPSWRAPSIFVDSPTCLRYKVPPDADPCSICVLAQLVPPDQASKDMPCWHIPLNKQGETLDSLYRSRTQEEVETAVANWLRAKIRELEVVAAGEPAKELCAPAKA